MWLLLLVCSWNFALDFRNLHIFNITANRHFIIFPFTDRYIKSFFFHNYGANRTYIHGFLCEFFCKLFSEFRVNNNLNAATPPAIGKNASTGFIFNCTYATFTQNATVLFLNDSWMGSINLAQREMVWKPWHHHC